MTMTAAWCCALLFASPIAGSPTAGRIRLDDGTIAKAEDLRGRVPDSLLMEIAECEEGLAARLGGAAFTLQAFEKAPDLLVVSTIEAGRARSIGQKILAARHLLHEHYLDPPKAPKSPPPPPAGVERPASPLVFEHEFVTVPATGYDRRARFTSVPLRNGDGVPFEGMTFDVTTTFGKLGGLDADPERDGHQLATDEDGVLEIDVEFGNELVPRTGIVAARGVKDPGLAAHGEFACLVDAKAAAPFVTVVYLLRDKPEDFTAVAEHLSVAKRLGGLRLEERTGGKKAGGKTFPVVPTMNYAYPPIAIVPDRAQKGEFARWETVNQAIHQAVHPMITARYGTLPYWAEEAIAWDMEEAITGSLWSFCGYRGFVFDADHKNWAARAREGVKAPADLKLDEVFAYRGEPVSRKVGTGPGGPEMTFDVGKFARAWALARCFSRDETKNAGWRGFLHAMGNAKPGAAGPALPLLETYVGPGAERALFEALAAGKVK